MGTNSLPSERELVDRLEVYLSQPHTIRPHKAVRIFREFDPGLGRADIVRVWYDRNKIRARYGPRNATLTEFDRLAGYAMALLSHCRWASLSQIQSRLRIRASKLDEIVSLLAWRDLIDLQRDQIKARPLRYTWVIDRIEVYEAKLSKWKCAIDQAAQHVWFASQSFVAMPEPSARVKSSVVDVCSRSDIGVLLWRDSEQGVIEVLPPQRRTPITHIGWYLNEAIVQEEQLRVQLRS